MSTPRHQSNNPAPDALPGRPPKHAEPVQAPPSVERALAGGGRPLEPAVRANMAARFGCGFFDVRVHDDARAAASARGLGARAYAAGPHIVFAAGRYAPGAPEGRRQLAHELAHVAQQQRGGLADAAEQRAERAADAAVAGRPVDRGALGGAPLGVHAQPEDKALAQPARPEEHRDAGEKEAGYGTSLTEVLDDFALDHDTLTPAHLAAIEQLALSIASQMAVRAHAKANVDIVGHTDTTGTESHNNKLGLDRANRVKEALQEKLGREQAPAVGWTVRSAGESAPLVSSGDNKKEPRNRRVEVKVTISAPPEATLPEPGKKKPIDLFPPDVLATPQPEDIWKKMEQNQRRIDELNRKIGKKQPKSAQDVLVEALAAPLDGLVNKLPISNSLKKKAREGIRDGIRAGSEKIAEAAIDAIGLPGQEAQALKAAVKAALKQKAGQTGGETP